MTSTKAISYFAKKIYRNYVEYLIDEGCSEREILELLKKVELEKPTATIQVVRRYIQYKFSLEWDYKKNIWKQVAQIGPPIKEEDPFKHVLNTDLISTLSKKDTETLLTDIKNIAQDTKILVNQIDKITKGIENIVSAISKSNKLE